MRKYNRLPISAATIAADIERLASELGVEPMDVTLNKYIQNGGVYSERKIGIVGGLNLIKKTFFAKASRDEMAVRAQQGVNTEVNRLRRFVGDTEWMSEKIGQLIDKMPPIKIGYKPAHERKKAKRTLHIDISDTHWGADLYKAEHLVNHGPKEEAAALWAVVKNVCEYKLEHRRETELVVNVLGDIIENQLHGPAGSAPLHIQTCRAIYYLSQAMACFASSFQKVTVNFAVGNHGRDMSIHPTRATSQKFNGIETTIYYAVKVACRDLKHVYFNQPMTPWVDYYSQGHRHYGTHGDTHLNPGNPGSKIDMKGIENQTNRINATLKGAEAYQVFTCGHVHHPLVTQLSNGVYIIINGSQTPPNGYAQSLNIMRSPQVQVMWESTPAWPVGDFRFVTANSSIKDSKISSFAGFEE